MSKFNVHYLGFTSKQVERMADMKLEGLRNHDIARIYNVNKNTIALYLRKRKALLAQNQWKVDG